ncbi:MAG TPA: phosphopantetheine-binding protein [Saprospiraceae bacterium]|nr:phosphopantetheine-binding protein [Saprospiraceae bacterium]
MQDIDNIKAIIKTIFENSEIEFETELGLDSRLVEDLGMDSLMIAELSVRIEDLYAKDVFENGMLYTVEEIIQILRK